jgi:dolichyl-phosphate beta-glucosyltransferase
LNSSRTLSVVVPAYNEERRLPNLLSVLENSAAQVIGEVGLTLYEVVVVDDGSTDSTTALLQRHPNLRVIRFDANRGKGAAVRAGILAAGGDLVLMTDVDMATPLDEVGKLLTAVDAGADIAIGSRALSDSQILIHQPWYREAMGRTFNVLLRLFTGLPFHDTQCGFKLYRAEQVRSVFERQRIDGFAYDAEVLVLARKAGLHVEEVPVRWSDDHRTTLSLVGAPTRMAVDLLRVGWLARRPNAFGVSRSAAKAR